MYYNDEKSELKSNLELGEFVSLQLLPGQDQSDHVLGQQSEGPEVQHFIPVVIHELQHLLQEELGALVLDIALRCGQECADRINCDAALRGVGVQYYKLLG